mmetsp:Transcript_28903/g.27804  ORF Transcript_28903/g.27804 Transcript_28903/m.27804 type:complete len:311 (-) Transcript_28903:4381-5313(-)
MLFVDEVGVELVGELPLIGGDHLALLFLVHVVLDQLPIPRHIVYEILKGFDFFPLADGVGFLVGGGGGGVRGQFFPALRRRAEGGEGVHPLVSVDDAVLVGVELVEDVLDDREGGLLQQRQRVQLLHHLLQLAQIHLPTVVPVEHSEGVFGAAHVGLDELQELVDLQGLPLLDPLLVLIRSDLFGEVVDVDEAEVSGVQPGDELVDVFGGEGDAGPFEGVFELDGGDLGGGEFWGGEDVQEREFGRLQGSFEPLEDIHHGGLASSVLQRGDVVLEGVAVLAGALAGVPQRLRRHIAPIKEAPFAHFGHIQ